jgi:hypothetical protein
VISIPILLGILMGIPATMTNRLNLHEAYIDVNQYIGRIRHPLLSPNGYEPDKKVGLGLNVNQFKAFYWNNNIDSIIDNERGQSQFRTISWKSEFGLRLSSGVDIMIGHRSTHMLDDRFKHNDEPFYNEDWIGIRWYLQRGQKRRVAVEERR